MSFAIAKFGGTSMADASVARKSASVLKSRPEIRMCVISATSGSTNILMTMAREASGGVFPEAGFKTFHERHLSFMKNLGGELVLVEEYCSRVHQILQGMMLLRETSPSALDDLVSYGELISSLLFAEALKAEGLKSTWLDARHLMKTSSDHGRAQPILELLRQHAENEIKPHLANSIVVTQGYIGSDLHGRTTTLGKEGSDYSTALFAEALDASEIQIWKDVAGVMTTDPRLVPHARTLSEISFTEISELTRFGAKVIHPDTFLPAIRAQIPVYVGYSQDPTVKGTRVVVAPSENPAVRAIALKRDQKWLSVKEAEGQNHPWFLGQVIQVLQQYRVTPTMLTTSENRVGVVIDKLYPLTPDLLRDMTTLGLVEVTEGEVIAVVGKNIRSESPIQSRILSHLKNVKPLMMSCGASDHAFCVMITPGHSEEIIRTLHAELLEQK
ncbi:MAG: aspartate kinase [Bacteriovoracia bacterium]